jgi:hypothetical protein
LLICAWVTALASRKVRMLSPSRFAIGSSVAMTAE